MKIMRYLDGSNLFHFNEHIIEFDASVRAKVFLATTVRIRCFAMIRTSRGHGIECNGAASRVLRWSTDGRWRRNGALADGAIGASASVVVLELLVRFVRRGVRWKGVGVDLSGWTLRWSRDIEHSLVVLVVMTVSWMLSVFMGDWIGHRVVQHRCNGLGWR